MLDFDKSDGGSKIIERGDGGSGYLGDGGSGYLGDGCSSGINTETNAPRRPHFKAILDKPGI